MDLGWLYNAASQALAANQSSLNQSDVENQNHGDNRGDLLNAGMSFMNAKQQGQDNLQAALTALKSAGPMAQKPHRQRSGQLVANTLLQALASGMANRK